jgi:hypothetical protein
MKSAAILIPIILTSTALAHITTLQDNRYAYATVTLNNGPDTPQTEEQIERFYSNPFQTLNESFDLAITNPAVGSASSSTAYESSLSTTQFSSSASISSNITTLPTGLVAGALAGFSNRVEFTLDDTTTFQIAGFLSGSGSIGGSILLFANITDDGESSESFFTQSAFNTTRQLNTFLTLEAGDYSFTTLSFTSSAALEYNQSVSSLAAHEITITVIPTPATTALLIFATPLLTRRRR